MEIIGDNYLLPKSRLKKLTEYLYEHKEYFMNMIALLNIKNRKKLLKGIRK